VPEVSHGDPVAELWDEYTHHHAPEVRERLILHYAPLVKFVAGRVASGLPQSVDQADLVSYGIFGLIDAIDKFDPSRGFKFETYAITRIKGAIIDELRSFDWVPRSVRAKARAIEGGVLEARERASAHARRRRARPGAGMSERDLARALSQISFVGLVALDEILAAVGERPGQTVTGDPAGDRLHDPVEAFAVDEMKVLLADAIDHVPERERLVLTLHYYEGLTLSEIGNVLGVTESRACQIHTKAILQLRARLGDPERRHVW
jgi:RNA polymerase sigma factor FliA